MNKKIIKEIRELREEVKEMDNAVIEVLVYLNEKTVGITLPCSQEKLNNFLASKEIRYALRNLDYYVDYQENDYICSWLQEKTLERVNDIAKELTYLNSEQIEVIGIYLKEIYSDIDEALQIVQDGDYAYYYDCFSMDEVAEEVADDLLTSYDNFVRNYFDYHAFGVDLAIENYYFFTQKGCIEFRQ